MIARAGEVLHIGLDLQERVARVLIRLDLGIQGPAVDLARHAERALDRADYRRLCEAGLTDREALSAAADAAILPLVANDRAKLATMRDALEKWRMARPNVPPAPALPRYEA
jgi:helicase